MKKHLPSRGQLPDPDEWDRQWQDHWSKIGPFPLILMGAKFWAGFKRWGRFMIKQGVFAQEEIGFGRITDSPKEAVDLIVRGLRQG